MTLSSCLKTSSNNDSRVLRPCLHLPREQLRECLRPRVPVPPQQQLEPQNTAPKQKSVAIVTGMELLSPPLNTNIFGNIEMSITSGSYSFDDTSYDSFAVDSLRLAHRQESPPSIPKKTRSIHNIAEELRGDEQSITAYSVNLDRPPTRTTQEQQQHINSCDSSRYDDDFEDFCNDSFARSFQKMARDKNSEESSISHCTRIPHMETHSCTGGGGRAA